MRRTISAASRQDSERPLTFAAICYRIRYQRAIATRDTLSARVQFRRTLNSEVSSRDTLLYQPVSSALHEFPEFAAGCDMRLHDCWMRERWEVRQRDPRRRRDAHHRPGSKARAIPTRRHRIGYQTEQRQRRNHGEGKRKKASGEGSFL